MHSETNNPISFPVRLEIDYPEKLDRLTTFYLRQIGNKCKFGQY